MSRNAHFLNRPPKDGCLLSQSPFQVFVARTHRKAIGLTQSWRDDYPQRKIQVAGHALNHRRLLIVLGTKDRDLWLDYIKQLGHDGRYPSKMPGPRRSLHSLGELLLCYICAESIFSVPWIHLLVRRREYNVHPLLLARSTVPGKIAWITGKVLFRPKLRWIDVDTHHHPAPRPNQPPCPPDQRQMPSMQIPHRWNQGHPNPFPLPAAAEPLHSRHRPHNPHASRG